MKPRLRYAALLAGVTVWVSCTDSPATPQTLLGTYALYETNGASLPAVFVLGHSCSTRMYGGTLTVDTASLMSIALDIDPLCDTDSTTYPRGILRASGVYALGGTTLMFPTQFGGISGVILAEPQGDRMAVRMGADLKEYWNDPLLLFGPRQPLAAAQH